MKILAIRGAGIASLSEPFEVRLDAPPLAGAGVLAIVGPTGAGKSTLLDALFLALFGRTPRLAAAERLRVLGGPDDEEALSPRDPRVLVRSDVDAAFAEVDFEGEGGARYRARWSVQRKRRGAGGAAFRRPEHALLALTDDGAQRLGGTKTEVLGLLEARLGLDFDQLRRSVVLAQGEIAAFLHADAQDRAELLERMTGTEIYGALSRELHDEAARRKARRDLCAEELAAIVSLPAPERAALEAEEAARAGEVRSAEETLAGTQARLRRTLDRIALARERDEARSRLVALEAELALLAPRRAEVAARRALLPLLPRFGELDRRREDQARLAAGLGPAEAERARLERELSLTAREQAEAARVASAARRADDAARTAETEARLRRAAAAEPARRAASAEAELARAEETLGRVAALEREAAEAVAHGEASERAWAERLRACPTLPEALAAVPGLAHAAPGSAEGLAEDLVARHTHRAREVAQAEEALARAERADALARSEQERAEQALAALADRAAASASRLARAAEKAEAFLLDAPTGRRDVGAGARFLARAQDEARARARARPGRIARAEVQQALQLPIGGEHALSTTEIHFEVRLPAAPRDPSEILAAAREREEALARALHQLDADLPRRRAELLAARRAESEDARRTGALRWELSRLADELGRVRTDLAEARAHAARLEAEHEAEQAARTLAALRRRLRPGDACLVCGQTVASDGAPREPARHGAPDSTRHDRGPHEHGHGHGHKHAHDSAPRDAHEPSPHDAHDSAPQDSAAHDPSRTALALALRDARGHEAELRLRDEMLGRLYAVLAREAPTAPALDLGALAEALERAEHERDAWAARAAALSAARAELEGALERSRSDEGRRLTAELEASRRAEARARAAHALDVARAAARRAGEERAQSGLDRLLALATGAPLPWLRARLVEHAAARRAALELPLARVQLEHARERRSQAETARAEAHARAAEGRALREAEAAAQAAEERARAAAAGAAQGLSVADARLKDLTAAVAACQAERDAADAELARMRGALPRLEAEAAALEAELTPLVTPHLAPCLREGEAPLALARALVGASGAGLDRAAAAIERSEIEVHAARAVLAERERRLAAQSSEGASAEVLVAEHARLEALARRQLEALERARSAEARVAERRVVDDAARARRAERQAALAQHEAELAVWADLDDALGSADGKKLRVHAQRLTLGVLVREASRHLMDLAPRYAIEVAPNELGIQVVDRHMGGEIRTATALSGGETFVVSLALALGLASLASRRMRLGTLFVDEGFGSLDAASLDVVLQALDRLESTGRQIGIVSHVPELEERFAARVEVRPVGAGKSRVVVVG